MTQKTVSEIIGVSEDCITYWENDRTYPQIKHYPKINAFLGYIPFPVDETTLGGKIKKYRITQGLSIKRLAAKINVEERTLVEWENDRVIPGKIKFENLKELFL